MPAAHTGLTVTELNRLISDALRKEPGIRNIQVTAEVSGFKNHYATGHWYFTLKDRESGISCVMFRQNNIRSAFIPRDGDSVTVTGSVELYSRDGKVQLYVQSMREAGTGSLYEQFEALKRKLLQEGLFDTGRKRTIPLFPKKVAVITSSSGAALHDILNVSGQRNPCIPLVLVPSGVQGAAAAAELAEALEKAAGIPEVDVIIMARGGGSPEDLWCFNDETLARAVAACPVPVVSGVGHETDFTICDYVADVRASTPSNAAEIVFPDRNELTGRTAYFRSGLANAVTGRIQLAMLQIHGARERLQRRSPERRLHHLTDLVHQYRHRLDRTVLTAVREKEGLLNGARMTLRYGMNRRAGDAESAFLQCRARLEAVSPLRVLDRGYAMVYDDSGRVIPSAAAAGRTEDMTLRFHDGRIAVRRRERKDGSG